MSTNDRKGNRTSIPARGGLRRSNTPPPPSVRLGRDGLPAERDDGPVSTSRPRGNEGEIPALNKPPADVVATRAASEPEPTAKTPPVVAPPPQEAVPPPRAQVNTLLSAAEAPAPAPAATPEAEDDGPAMSQSPRSLSSPPGARRKGRGSNLKGSGKSIPPPSVSEVPTRPSARPVAEALPTPEVPTAAPPPVPVPAAARGDEAPAKSALASVPPPSGPMSAPPASDLDQRFFEHGDSQPHAHIDDGSDLDSYDPRMAHKNSPEARARREKNWMYVKWAAGVCVVLMAAALVRNSMRHSEEPVAALEPPVVVTVVGSAAPSAAWPQKVEPAPVVSAAAPALSGSAAAAAPSGSAAIPVAAAEDLPSAAPSGSARFQEPVASLGAAAKAQGTDPAAVPNAGTPPMADPTEAEKKSAVQERKACESFLNQGAFAKAVEAGERSVQLDPSDGDAWLMLGAAYQSMGKSAEARRSFSSCVAEGKRGQINECRAMLR